MLKRRSYRDDPINLWPPGHIDDPTYYATDTPATGIFADSQGVTCHHQDWVGDELMREVATEGTPVLVIYGLPGAPGAWALHPDLLAFYHRPLHTAESSPFSLRTVTDQLLDFLVKRGWEEVVFVCEGLWEETARQERWWFRRGFGPPPKDGTGYVE